MFWKFFRNFCMKTFRKADSGKGVSLWILKTFSEQLFLRKTSARLFLKDKTYSYQFWTYPFVIFPKGIELMKTSIKGGHISWKLFHDVLEKDSLLEANLRLRSISPYSVRMRENTDQKIHFSHNVFEAEFGGLFLILKFNFQTTFWTIRRKRWRNFVVHLQIGLKISVIRGSRQLDNLFSPEL